jgi:hypothetical protein
VAQCSFLFYHNFKNHLGSKNSLKHKKRKSEDLQKEDNNHDQTLWPSIARNYEMIQGAHIRNSFILLMALSEAKEPLSTTQLSEIISKKVKEKYTGSLTLSFAAALIIQSVKALCITCYGCAKDFASTG